MVDILSKKHSNIAEDFSELTNKVNSLWEKKSENSGANNTTTDSSSENSDFYTQCLAIKRSLMSKNGPSLNDLAKADNQLQNRNNIITNESADDQDSQPSLLQKIVILLHDEDLLKAKIIKKFVTEAKQCTEQNNWSIPLSEALFRSILNNHSSHSDYLPLKGNEKKKYQPPSPLLPFIYAFHKSGLITHCSQELYSAIKAYDTSLNGPFVRFLRSLLNGFLSTLGFSPIFASLPTIDLSRRNNELEPAPSEKTPPTIPSATEENEEIVEVSTEKEVKLPEASIASAHIQDIEVNNSRHQSSKLSSTHLTAQNQASKIVTSTHNIAVAPPKTPCTPKRPHDITSTPNDKYPYTPYNNHSAVALSPIQQTASPDNHNRPPGGIPPFVLSNSTTSDDAWTDVTLHQTPAQSVIQGNQGTIGSDSLGKVLYEVSIEDASPLQEDLKKSDSLEEAFDRVSILEKSNPHPSPISSNNSWNAVSIDESANHSNQDLGKNHTGAASLEARKVIASNIALFTPEKHGNCDQDTSMNDTWNQVSIAEKSTHEHQEKSVDDSWNQVSIEQSP